MNNQCYRYVTGHGVPEEQLARMRDLSRKFFCMPEEGASFFGFAHLFCSWLKPDSAVDFHREGEDSFFQVRFCSWLPTPSSECHKIPTRLSWGRGFLQGNRLQSHPCEDGHEDVDGQEPVSRCRVQRDVFGIRGCNVWSWKGNHACSRHGAGTAWNIFWQGHGRCLLVCTGDWISSTQWCQTGGCGSFLWRAHGKAFDSAIFSLVWVHCTRSAANCMSSAAGTLQDYGNCTILNTVGFERAGSCLAWCIFSEWWSHSFMLQDETRNALQVLRKDGEWVYANPIPGYVTCIQPYMQMCNWVCPVAEY